ncbi:MULTISPECIES: hypothetical protein [Xanthomonas]|uniref:Uncharacterized protein n=2 Tax=Xanthomonas hortorum TaxID=56454 RepID=A0A9X4HA75_9XANT|nr:MULTISPECIES: hypothetical protein [Xanthomonas]MCE4307388.1 hypothetical protein [Xanthomonas hortorum pv. vitians]MCE4339699.1 hypothetical protein [Xanthomonas hortorum pv. vitians]MCE4356175.1 hypothetical protein [Xanthomonas hortorum pv. pelargonii]MCE4373756.1 hypothetical protein [Xanthomonas hortorum pv. hederae]MCE4509281.1 hypothetical protein [Xanthomonas hortorum pv. vitians]
MGSIVKLDQHRRRRPAPCPAPEPEPTDTATSTTVTGKRLLRFIGRTASDLVAGAMLAILAVLRRPVRWAAQLSIVALIGSCVVAAISPQHEAKMVLAIGAIALVLFLIHATIQGLTGALSRFHQH